MTTTFDIYENIQSKPVRFKNRYEIELAGTLYLPEGYESKHSSAIAFAGPFGAVKEQASGLYAQELATYGFVTLAFDPSRTGESGGFPRNLASPETFTEDFSAAIDFLGTLTFVNKDSLGIMGICGLSGMALTAATVDSRIKATATSVMYDISRSVSEGVGGGLTSEQRQGFLDYIAAQRDNLAAGGEHVTGPHEPFFTPDNEVVHSHGLPEALPEDPHPVLAAFYDYYKTGRGYHERSVNSTGAWESTTPQSFLAFPQYSHLDNLGHRPVLTLTGENAHSRYFSEEVHAKITGPKELVVVPGANHVDLYDRKNLIPFDRLGAFFEENL